MNGAAVNNSYNGKNTNNDKPSETSADLAGGTEILSHENHLNHVPPNTNLSTANELPPSNTPAGHFNDHRSTNTVLKMAAIREMTLKQGTILTDYHKRIPHKRTLPSTSYGPCCSCVIL